MMENMRCIIFLIEMSTPAGKGMTGWSEDTEAFFMGVRVLVVSNNVF